MQKEAENFGRTKKTPYLCSAFANKCNDSVAQLVEQLTLNQWVEGSSPSGVTIYYIENTYESILLGLLWLEQ